MEPSQINTDTICAVSTPPGVGGIAVIRISGPQAIQITQSIWQGADLTNAKTHTAHLGTILDTDNRPLDQCVATIYRAPKSYTGQDTVELSVHGSTYIQRTLLDTLTHAGARIAQPGEYTRRAFAAGKLNLAQAEAVADIIAADSRAAHHIAATQMRDGYTQRLEQLRQQLTDIASLLELELDFTDQDVEFASRQHLQQLTDTLIHQIRTLRDSYATGHAIRTGIPVAIIGPTNAGKSSLLNALLGHDRAIVSDIHGTTRDTIDETVNIGDYTFRLIDTAGLRHTDDPIERIGIDRTHNAIQTATIILRITDATDPHTTQQLLDIPPHATLINIHNKIDLISHTPADSQDTIHISAKTHQGINTLRQRLIDIVDRRYKATAGHNILVTNARHAAALSDALESAQRVRDALDAGLSADLIAQDLREAGRHLAHITSAVTTPDILTTIFTRFCIGK